ncbi:MAG: 50S ribosomal protein L15 [Chitinivibrionales bacterium]|nr:50S ribosomal protein L15 [Chitinivibrionales bacterium]MBD3397224.1 50S ribosomal protein L15 [Chitinivibrionales bacterium]
MKLNDVRPAAGSRTARRRIGRGQGSGSGCTAGRGQDGYGARRGSGTKAYFEGGQTPMSRRIPKRGFNNKMFSTRYQIVNVGDLEKVDADALEIDPKWLSDNGLIGSDAEPVKVLGNGELTKKLTVRADSFSKSAREKIEKAKGKVEVIERA